MLTEGGGGDGSGAVLVTLAAVKIVRGDGVADSSDNDCVGV